MRSVAPGLASVVLALIVFLLFSSVPPTDPSVGSGRPASGATGVPPPLSAGPVTVAPGFAPTAGVVALGPLPARSPLEVVVGLALADPAGLSARIALEYAAGSPEFHQFLPVGALAAQYGPGVGEYDRALAYFQGYGLTVTPSPDRLWITLTGSAARLGAAFDTSFELYRTAGRVFYSHDTPARLPAGIAWSGALGLGNETALRPAAPPGVPRRLSLGAPASSCPTGALVPSQIQSAYGSSALLARGVNGSGFRVGIVDAYDAAEPQTTLASDLATFARCFGLPDANVSFLYPVPADHDLNTTFTGWQDEEALDLEWVRAMAPGAAVDMTFAPDEDAGLYAAVDWLVAHQAVNVLSLSWGEPDVGVYNAWAGPCHVACNASSDGSYELLSPVFAEAAAEGIGVFAASGDCGAADGTDGVSTNYPASDPSVVGVGGTNLTLGAGGAYGSEVGWGGNLSGRQGPGCDNAGGAGGGYSPFPRPVWQAGPGLPSNPGTRAVPDVSMDAGTGVLTVINGAYYSVGGTSLATPLWAGAEAIADTAAGRALGFLAPALYGVFNSPDYAASFHDITRGWNGYYAGPGWDAITGIGTPRLNVLVPELAADRPSTGHGVPSLTASDRLGPAPLTVSFAVHVTGGPPPALVDVDFGDGNASIATAGAVNHTYTFAGVFVATAVAYDRHGNVSLASPLAIVVGGGSSLVVNLSANPLHPALGQSTNLTATVSGGTPPYRYWYAFGDGTYLNWTSSRTVAHSYGSNLSACAVVVVADAASPPDGGSSNRLAIAVGSAANAGCTGAAPLRAVLSSSARAADVPGDFPLHVNVTGGAPPISITYVSDDPYVRACDCGIFHTAGSHTIEAFVNDSVNQETVAFLNVTVYPALTAQFAASAMSGVAPLVVRFSVTAAEGGNAPDPSRTAWQFGNGGSATGANVSETYATPGNYLAIGSLADATGGNASEAFLIDVLPPAAPGQFALTATVTPAVHVPAGETVRFAAATSGTAAPSLVRWQLGTNDSAFGTTVNQTFASPDCGVGPDCPLVVDLAAQGALGSLANLSFVLPDAVGPPWSALVLFDNRSAGRGTTPFELLANASAVGMPGARVNWSFGDGTNGNGSTVAHVYYRPGNFTILETATDPAGDRLVRTHALIVNGSVYSPPVLAGSVAPLSGVAPLTVNYVGSASGGAGPPYSYLWSFGDGTEAATANGSHTYAGPGNFSSVLDVTDRDHIPANRTFEVRVYGLTSVLIGLNVSSSRIAAGSSVSVVARAVPACDRASVPGCGSLPVPVRAEFLPAGDPASAPGSEVVWEASASPATFAISAPKTAGTYDLVAAAVGPNYTGSAQVTLNVTAVGAPFGVAVAPAVLLASGAVVAGVLGIAAARAYRLRPPPTVPIGAR